MKKKKLRLIIFLLILFISIGFAYLSTNLSLFGTGIFKQNSWDIYFDNITEDTYKSDIVTPAVIDNKITINASVNLKQPKSTYTMYADIVNDGSIDAMLDSWTINNDMDTDESKVFDLKLTYADGVELTKYDLLSAKSFDTIKVTAIYKDDISNSELLTNDGSLDLSITLNYVQADEDALERNTSEVIVSYNYNDSFVFNSGESMDTGYKIDWDKDFSVAEKVYIPGDLTQRYLFIGTYSETAKYEFNIELKNKKYRLWLNHSGSELIDDSSTEITNDRDLISKVYWNADDKTVSCNLKGDNTNFSLNETKNMTGVSTKSFKIGTQDWRSYNVFNLITVNYLIISSNYDIYTNYYLPTPVRDGYTFDGWYKDTSFTNKVLSTDKVSRNITLYAKWIAN